MDWDMARVIRTEDNKHQHWIREVIEIRKQGPGMMNRAEGAYMLSHTWSSVLQRRADSGRPDPPVRKFDRRVTPP